MIFRNYRSGDYPRLFQLWEELDMSPRERGDTPEGIQVKLEVHRENIAAVKLYEKCGFTPFPDYGLYMLRQPEEIDIEQL